MSRYKTRIDNVKARIQGLTPYERNLYIQLKAAMPADQQQDLRDAFLIFQDRDMMQVLTLKYLPSF